MERVLIEKLHFVNKPFWRGYFLIGYGDRYCEKSGMNLPAGMRAFLTNVTGIWMSRPIWKST